ncbi:NAD(P)H-binding protein [Spirillospora sp. CA-294931]|uniref:NAD(P)H-binding protein n=1 Tax=Spirillospora sp. CA-294931 TaxID=3240042 RepID=UPI003D91ACAA
MVAVVFGAQGNVGRHVAAGLRQAGETVRLTSRNPRTGDFVAADLERPETLPGALDGARKVFLYAKAEGAEGFAEAAKAAGVEHVVLLSSEAIVHPGAEDSFIARQHRAVELAIERSGIAWTFVRPGAFAGNCRWWWADSIREEGLVRGAYPEARTAPIHEKDIADIAVTALTKPGHEGKAYTVHGPESLSLRTQVGQIADALGRDIVFEQITPDEAREDMSRSLPPVVVDAVLNHWASANGVPAETSDIVHQVTGQPAHTFAEWARTHKADFL